MVRDAQDFGYNEVRPDVIRHVWVPDYLVDEERAVATQRLASWRCA